MKYNNSANISMIHIQRITLKNCTQQARSRKSRVSVATHICTV